MDADLRIETGATIMPPSVLLMSKALGMNARRLLHFIVVAIFLSVSTDAPAQVRGQDALRIAAVVNNDLITVFDLQNRVRLTMVTSNLPDTPETYRRLAPQVLRALIDEKLKTQEAKRLNIKVEPPEIDAIVAKIEAGNKMPPGKMKEFLESAGVPIQALRDRVGADIAWNKLIGMELGRSIRISEDEIDDIMRQADANKGKPEYHVAEIVLPVDSPEQEREVAQLANRLIRQLQSGTPFAAVAQNFSRSATAAVGGDLGWVKSGEMEASIESALLRLQPGQISDAIRTDEGFSILMLRNRRANPGAAAGSQMVSLTQVIVPTPSNATTSQESVARAQAESLTKPATACADMERAAKSSGSPMSGSLGTVPIESLPDDIQKSIKDLALNTPTKPERTKNGFRVLMVCERKTSDAVTQQREQIRDRLTDDRLSISARRYLRDLRRSAFIDVRI